MTMDIDLQHCTLVASDTKMHDTTDSLDWQVDRACCMSREEVERMLEAANWAPTHGRTEPWRYIVLGQEGMQAFANITLEVQNALRSFLPESSSWFGCQCSSILQPSASTLATAWSSNIAGGILQQVHAIA